MTSNAAAGAPGSVGGAGTYGYFLEQFLDRIPSRGSPLEELHRWVDEWRGRCPTDWKEEFEEDAVVSLALAWMLDEESGN